LEQETGRLLPMLQPGELPDIVVYEQPEMPDMPEAIKLTAKEQLERRKNESS
jgi:hypothetical protein